MSRYESLTHHLQGRTGDLIRMSFAEIEQVLGRKLPPSAGTHRAWWSNNATNNVMTRAWLAAGFRSEQVDLPGRRLTFRRVEEDAAMAGFQEAQATFQANPQTPHSKFALFGWMKGTITIAPGVDLTEPPCPEWADLADEHDEPSA